MRCMRFYLPLVAILIAGLPGAAVSRAAADGSTKENAIPLRQRGTKAIEEEMQWMAKLFGYTPVLTMRDTLAAAVREIKAGKKEVDMPTNLDHRTVEHGGRWCSYWRFKTPQGTKEIYFDTGVSTKTPGEMARQESTRASYLQDALGKLKIKG